MRIINRNKMAIGEAGFREILGKIVTSRDELKSFLENPKEYMTIQGNVPSDKEFDFLSNPYIQDLIREFTDKLDIRFDSKQDKGR